MPRSTPDEVSTALQDSLSLIMRRLRQVPVVGDLSHTESLVLSHLSRDAPVTSAELARAERVRPQSMGATIGSLEARGLVARRRDATDARRILVTLTPAGRARAAYKRTARGEQIARALASGFSDAELAQLLGAAPLIERLAERIR